MYKILKTLVDKAFENLNGSSTGFFLLGKYIISLRSPSLGDLPLIWFLG
ncbi:MAG TPA: hypothetical protein V6D35_12885 [Candidatus Sericytochromatia bacterium]